MLYYGGMQSLTQNTILDNLDGAVYAPGDEQYEEARKPWLRNYDSKPALIVSAGSVSDIQKAVQYAAAADMPIAIQSSGHGAIKPTDGAVLIKTDALTQCSIDATAQTATFEPGTMVKDLVTAAGEHGLSPITGDSPYVSATGFTLGGGQGWLSRQYGLGADSLIEAKMVTLSGEIVTANASEHPDLFWALKGGSGNFGVVVSLTVQLHPVSTGFGGAVYFAAEHAREILEQYSTWALTLPANSTVFLQAVSLPPIPQLPPAISGKRVVALQLFCNGDPGAAQAELEQFISKLGVAPLVNFTHQATYADFLSSAPQLPPTAAMGTSALQADISQQQIPVLASYMQGTATLSPVIQIRPWGGALQQASADSLLQYTDVGFSVYATVSLRGDDAAQQQTTLAFAELAEHIALYGSGKQFINFIASSDAIKQAYSDQAVQKLLAVKQTYDPKNLFRCGHVIA